MQAAEKAARNKKFYKMIDSTKNNFAQN